MSQRDSSAAPLEPPRSCDCLIVGGGPAGATLAGMLAAWGRTSVLVHDGRDRHGMPEETMLPGAARILERCDLTPVFAEHRFFGTERHGVIWEQEEIELSRREGAERGFKVERGLFDSALRDWARRQGAIVLDRHRVSNPLPAEGEGTTSIRREDGESIEIHAHTLVVATGRGRPSSLLDTDVEITGAETVAISRVGTGDPKYLDASVIEAVAEGWLWWLPLRSGRVCLSTFLDGWEYRKVGRDLLESAQGHAVGPAATHTQGELSFAAKGTPRFLTTPCQVLLVGDAASTVDPLSSQGIEKALGSAEAAACAANTVIEHPELRARVIEHHTSWERGLWHAHAGQTAAFYGRQARFGDAPFWRKRRTATAKRTEPVLLPTTLRLHPGLERRAILHRQGRYLVEEPGFSVPGTPEALSRLGPVPLAPLIEVLTTARDLPETLRGAAQQAQLFPLSPRSVQEAVEDLFRRGFLNSGEPGSQ